MGVVRLVKRVGAVAIFLAFTYCIMTHLRLAIHPGGLHPPKGAQVVTVQSRLLQKEGQGDLCPHISNARTSNRDSAGTRRPTFRDVRCFDSENFAAHHNITLSAMLKKLQPIMSRSRLASRTQARKTLMSLVNLTRMTIIDVAQWTGRDIMPTLLQRLDALLDVVGCDSWVQVAS